MGGVTDMGQDNFGLKIGVEGEREFRQALSDINQTFKVLGSEMALATSHLKKTTSPSRPSPPETPS